MLGLLPPSSRLTRLRLLLRGRLHDDLAGAAFAGKGDLVHVHVPRQGGAGRRAVAGHDVNHAVGEAGFLGQRRHAQGRQRRLLGRLEDDGIAASEGRTPLPRLHQQREVPRNDLADDADGFVARVAEIRPFDGDGLAVILVGPAGVIAIRFDGEGKVGVERIAVGFAVVERFQSGQLRAMLFDKVGELVEQPAALGGAGLGPGAFLERLASGFDGEIDVGLIALGDLADGLAGGGIEGGEGFAGNAVEPFAADEQRLVLDLWRLGAWGFLRVAVATMGNLLERGETGRNVQRGELSHRPARASSGWRRCLTFPGFRVFSRRESALERQATPNLRYNSQRLPGLQGSRLCLKMLKNPKLTGLLPPKAS